MRFKGVCGIYGIAFYWYILKDILTVLFLYLCNNIFIQILNIIIKRFYILLITLYL